MMTPTELHREIAPAILYFGTPVVVISTLNEDATTNIAPMSSAWWLGWTCVLGFDASSKTPQNLLRTGECVLNLPSAALVAHVDRLACLSASDPLPLHKSMLGYRSATDKFAASGLTPIPSVTVTPARIRECPVQLEAVFVSSRPIGSNDPNMRVPAISIEVRIVKVHATETILSDVFENRIDASKWQPLIMTFRQFFTTGHSIHGSKLSAPPEEAYGGRAPQRRGSAPPIGD
jgi:flavin reductase (DIM6/NTAB) family NADH-FMN oxidoreductase RutF